jgi:hypothetical protein
MIIGLLMAVMNLGLYHRNLFIEHYILGTTVLGLDSNLI